MSRINSLRIVCSLGLALALMNASAKISHATEARTLINNSTGELSLLGHATVDGWEAVSGTTVFSGSVIETNEHSHAVVSLGTLGRVELTPRSRLKLSFSGGHIEGLLQDGGARFSTPGGVAVSVETADARVSAARLDEPTLFAVDVSCGNTSVATHLGRVVLEEGAAARQLMAGESASAGRASGASLCAAAQSPTQTPPQNQRSRKKLFGWLLVAGAAFAALTLLVITNENEGQVFDPCAGQPIIISGPSFPCSLR